MTTVEGLPDAVIFDCDGTLVDSERLAQRSWTEVLRRYGYELTAEDTAALFGRPYPSIYDYLAERVTILPGRSALWDEFARIMFELVSTELETFPDAAATVRALAAQGVPLAVASSSPRDRLDHTLAASGLADLFGVVIAGDEIEHGKPEPDIFLAAAAGLGVRPGSCVVVEDSPPGVAAACAAGARVVGVVRHADHRDALADAYLLVDVLSLDAIRAAARTRTGETEPTTRQG